jgi:hypothetical protein
MRALIPILFLSLSPTAFADQLVTTCADQVRNKQIVVRHDLVSQKATYSITERGTGASVASGMFSKVESNWVEQLGFLGISYEEGDYRVIGVALQDPTIKDLASIREGLNEVSAEGVLTYGDDGSVGVVEITPGSCSLTRVNHFCGNEGDAIEARFCEGLPTESSNTSCSNKAATAVELFHKMPTSWALGEIEIRDIWTMQDEASYYVRYGQSGGLDLYMIVYTQKSGSTCQAKDLTGLDF